MTFLKSLRGGLSLYGMFVAICAGWILVDMLTSPSEQANAVLLGLSLPRLIIALGLFLAFLSFSTLTLYTLKNPGRAEGFAAYWFGGRGVSRGLVWCMGISLGLGMIGCLLPAYRLGAWSGYWTRIQPVMVFLLLGSLATWTLFLFMRIKTLDIAPLRTGLPLFFLSVAILGGMLYSGFGIIAQEDFWYGAGVPLLASQLLVASFGGILFMRLGTRAMSKRTEFLMCMLLFAITAFLWAREPLQRSFFFTEPSPPGQAFYPFADAALFDAASQFAAIGQKIFIFNTLFFERPFYLSFLVYLHFFLGQDFELLMAVQAAIFAVLPVLVYLIGRSLDARAVGFASAIAIIFRGLNSISASNLMDTAGPKIMLTDFPTAIGLALVILLVCEWLKQPARKLHFPAWIGGAIGLTLMLRTNAVILIALIPLYAMFQLSKAWKKWLLSSFLMLVGVIAITLPWELRNLSLGGMMYGPIVTKFQSVIQTRYPSPPEPGSSLPQQHALNGIILESTQPVMTLYQVEPAEGTTACQSILCFSTNHFLHNIFTSLLTLPTSPVLDDLRHLIRASVPYWRADWDGTLTATAVLFLSLNLFFITLGISLAWKEKRLPGLAPLAILVAYNISNGLARTSGGRYLVPTDWILLIYYLTGVLHLLAWIANNLGIRRDLFALEHHSETLNKGTFPARVLGALATLCLLGALIPLSENLYLPRYQNMGPREILADNRARLEATGLKLYDLEAFLGSPGANILVGRALYPRYYKMDQGEFVRAFYPYNTLGFPRTAFKLIGPAGETPIVLPGLVAASIPHGGDLLVLGCNGGSFLDALVVISLEKDGEIYVRNPRPPLQCPMPEPVCNNNSACQ